MDGIVIGNNFFVWTVNTFVTAFVGLAFAIALFRYQRKIRRDDEAKKTAIDKEKEEEIERHHSLQQMIADRFGLIDRKLTAYCESNHDEHKKFEQKMGRHLHRTEDGLPYFLDV